MNKRSERLGKSLIIRLQAISEAEPDGQTNLFFELNGQPRVIRVVDRSRAVATKAKTGESGIIGREEAAGRAVFGHHVGDRCTVGQRQRIEAGAIELHEAADHFVRAALTSLSRVPRL